MRHDAFLLLEKVERPPPRRGTSVAACGRRHALRVDKPL
nr:MAG TPA: hypothetical protein [Caudoviricetes sp.]